MNTPSEYPGFFEKFNSWISGSITIRIMSITILVLLLMIPNAMIRDIIFERQTTNEQVYQDIRQIWGQAQTVCGPVVSVPCRAVTRDEKGVVTETRYWSHFLPRELNISGNVEPEVRNRGIYEMAVYATDLQVKGVFDIPDPQTLGIDKENFNLAGAVISVGIPDMRGIKEKVMLKTPLQNTEFGPGVPTANVISEGISTLIQFPTEGELTFSFNLQLNGSGDLNFVPLGKETTVSLASPWPHPSFRGNFSPIERNITKDGFTANWKVLDLNRNFPQAWKGERQGIYESAFGVDLLIPVDHYQQSMRSAKYAILFISLTFLVFFFIETINRKRIHPIQYILVGLALSLFFVLLLSLSEHIGFNGAFLSAAAGTTLLITIYSSGMLADRKLTALMAALLVVLYGFIYTILQLEDMALLVGSIGLFVVLAAVMFWSRKVDWYRYSDNRSLSGKE
jgi:inner membrane protein